MRRQTLTNKQIFFRGLINTSSDASHRSRHCVLRRKRRKPSKLCSCANLSSELNSLIHRRGLPWKRTQVKAAVGVRGGKKKERNRLFAQKIALPQMKGKHLLREIFLSYNAKSAKIRSPAPDEIFEIKFIESPREKSRAILLTFAGNGNPEKSEKSCDLMRSYAILLLSHISGKVLPGKETFYGKVVVFKGVDTHLARTWTKPNTSWLT